MLKMFGSRSYFVAKFLCLALGLLASVPSALARAKLSAGGHEGGMRAAEFELKDQHDQPFRYRFPQSRITVLIFGDRKGSEQIEGWVRPLYNRYQTRIEQYGVAVLSAVPSMMRGLVRGMFKRKVKYPVLLDWKGEVAKVYQYESRQANLIIVDRNGRIVYRTTGAASEAKLHWAYEQIDRLLAEQSP
jgi:peroxiredoxin